MNPHIFHSPNKRRFQLFKHKVSRRTSRVIITVDRKRFERLCPYKLGSITGQTSLKFSSDIVNKTAAVCGGCCFVLRVRVKRQTKKKRNAAKPEDFVGKGSRAGHKRVPESFKRPQTIVKMKTTQRRRSITKRKTYQKAKLKASCLAQAKVEEQGCSVCMMHSTS